MVPLPQLGFGNGEKELADAWRLFHSSPGEMEIRLILSAVIPPAEFIPCHAVKVPPSPVMFRPYGSAVLNRRPLLA